MWKMANREPMISFTFDDFPASALHVAGRVLADNDISGTYYTSFGLMDTVAPTGPIFGPDDIPLLLEQGHELGCHTYHHLHSYDAASTTLFPAEPAAKLLTLSTPTLMLYKASS